jgi:hypothetical protein
MIDTLVSPLTTRTRIALVIARGIAAFVRAALAAILAAAAAAPMNAQTLPPIHQLGQVEHSSTELLGSVSAARALPDGRVLIHDLSRRRVLLFDSTLGSFDVIADATSATGNAYSSQAGGLIRYLGDSSLFVDPSSLTMTVISGTGKVVRVIAVPNARDVNRLIGGSNGTPGIDGDGRLVYLGAPKSVPGAPAPQDSAPLIAFDLRSRRADTLTKLLRAGQHAVVKAVSPEIGEYWVLPIDPMPRSDDWAVMADGSVAVVRVLDYHVDWIRPGARITSTRNVPFAWMRLDDSAKAAFMDSTKAVVAALEAERQKRVDAGGDAGSSIAFPLGRPLVITTLAQHRMLTRMPTAPLDAFVPSSSLPDYAPPFAPGAVRSDLNGHLWVRTSIVVNGGSVYDVISDKGELVDRVQVPARRVIAGFGNGGIVYMGVRDGSGVRLEQARWR